MSVLPELTMRVGSLFIVGTIALTTKAAAQAVPPGGEGVDGHGFVPAPMDGSLRAPLVVHRIGGWSPQTAFGAGLFEYADAPLMWCARSDDELGCLDEEALLDNIFALNTSGGYALNEHLRFFGSVPLYLTSRSDHSTGGAGIGDFRVGAQAALFRDGPIHVGIAPWLDLPTGDEARFQGVSGLAAGALVAAAVDVGPLTVSSDLGSQFSPENQFDPNGDDRLLAGLGLGYAPSHTWGVTVESRVTPRFLSAPAPGTGAPSELFYTFRYRLKHGLQAHIGASNALSQGPGAARMRVFFGLGWAQDSDIDLDGDGLVHDQDGCPRTAEIFNGWEDEDGCPEDPVTFDVEVSSAGRPVEGALLQVVGAVPNRASGSYVGTPGTELQITARYGDCQVGSVQATVTPGMPPVPVELMAEHGTLRIQVTGTTGEPIPSAQIAWVHTGTDSDCHPDEDATLDDSGQLTTIVGATDQTFVITAAGLGPRVVTAPVRFLQTVTIETVLEPPLTRIRSTGIALADTLWFHYNSATIEPDAHRMVEEVAAVMLSQPELGTITIVGHTDDLGTPETNMALSTMRAEAVRARLVEHGVPIERLQTVGRGATEPASTNRSRRGRAQNRRVEFLTAPTEGS